MNSFSLGKIRSHLEPGHPQYLPFVFVLHGKWLAIRPGTTILLQRYHSFWEMLD